MKCECSHLRLNGEITGTRNLNPDCPEHGFDSAWWKSPEQVARREAENAKLAALRAEAERVRQGGTPKPPCKRCHRRHFDFDPPEDHEYRPVVPSVS